MTTHALCAGDLQPTQPRSLHSTRICGMERARRKQRADRDKGGFNKGGHHTELRHSGGRGRRTSHRRPFFERLETRQLLAGDVAVISINDVTFDEGDAGTQAYEFTVSVDIVLDQDLTMQVDVADVGDGDGQADLQPIVAQTLTIPAGQQSATVSVAVLGETRVESDETFLVQLSNAATAGDEQTEFAKSIGVGSIINDDSARLSLVSISVDEGTASQGVGGVTPATLILSLTDATGADVTLDVPVTVQFDTADDSAVAGDDYAPIQANTATINAGHSSLSITVDIEADSLPEANEQFRLVLSNLDASGRDVTLDSSGGVVTILDDDQVNSSDSSSLAGVVFVDANDNGQFDDNESGLPGVTVILAGTSNVGISVSRTTSTGEDGAYLFDELPSGTFELTQIQPTAFNDGPESIGAGGGESGGEPVDGKDVIRNIILGNDESLDDYNFSERGLHADYVSRRLAMASTPAPAVTLRALVEWEHLHADHNIDEAGFASDELNLASSFRRQATKASDPSTESPADRALVGETDPLDVDSGSDAGDTSGGDTLDDLTGEGPLIELRLEATDLLGNIIDQVVVGETFEVRVLAEDLRSDPEGVFAAFLDVQHDASLASVVEASDDEPGFAIEFGPEFPNDQKADLADGRVDETGAIAGLATLGGGEFLLFRVRYRAENTGTLSLFADPADAPVVNDSLLFGLDQPVPVGRIDYGATSLEIVAMDTGGPGDNSSGEGESATLPPHDPLLQDALSIGGLSIGAVDQLMALPDGF